MTTRAEIRARAEAMGLSRFVVPGPRGQGFAISDAECDLVIAGMAEGHSLLALSEATGWHRHSLGNAVRRRREDLAAGGMAAPSPRRGRRPIAGAHMKPPVDAALADRALKMQAGGMTIREIAKTFGRCGKTIGDAMRARRLELDAAAAAAAAAARDAAEARPAPAPRRVPAFPLSALSAWGVIRPEMRARLVERAIDAGHGRAEIARAAGVPVSEIAMAGGGV